VTRLKLWIAALGAILAALVAAWLNGRQSADVRYTRRRVEAAQQANEVRDEVNDMGADERRDALARWMRD
jgi:hypothetical protein